jgi:SIR2-like domain
MTYVLLTGAGFSRNWGGWLANEAFEYLIGSPEVDDNLKHLLWKCKADGSGFEGALAELQEEYLRSKSAAAKKPLDTLEAAIVGMFNHMNQALRDTTFEPQNEMQYLIRTFLIRFDAIFTLNQDFLLEYHYLNDNIALGSSRRWNGFQIPGMKPLGPNVGFDPTPGPARMWTPDEPTNFKEQPGAQPYFKLHGSVNWTGGGAGQSRLLIMGGNKFTSIAHYPLLSWYHKLFAEYLSRATKLMVIGYSFSDPHINEAIMKAADAGNLRLFIIDPQGVDILNKNAGRPLVTPDPLQVRLNQHIIGASRRPLTAIFGNDKVEHRKLTRFFSS